jgi:enoyl-CoA hydratase
MVGAMSYENILVETDGPVATITLNRPERLNALSPGLLSDLDTALRELRPGDDIRVVRLRGAGRAFCSGYDLRGGGGDTDESEPEPRRGDALADFGESSIALDREGLRTMIDRWLWMWNYRKPIIAQTHSYCISGGLDLIGACDIVFAAEGTRFGHPAGRALGIPVMIGMLPFRIGGAATKDLLFTGDLIEAARAKELGLVTHVVPADELDERAAAFCHRVALTPMDALTVHKHVSNRALEIMGIRLAAMEGAEYDSIFHMTPAAAEFSRRSREEGLRAALDWRDGPFRAGPAADHDAANRNPSHDE